MTIKVTITNDEPEGSRTILVTKLAFEKGRQGERATGIQHIQPGKSASFYIHLLTDLRVEELAE